jgi:hypothetical protein
MVTTVQDSSGKSIIKHRRKTLRDFLVAVLLGGMAILPTSGEFRGQTWLRDFNRLQRPPTSGEYRDPGPTGKSRGKRSTEKSIIGPQKVTSCFAEYSYGRNAWPQIALWPKGYVYATEVVSLLEC